MKIDSDSYAFHLEQARLRRDLLDLAVSFAEGEHPRDRLGRFAKKFDEAVEALSKPGYATHEIQANRSSPIAVKASDGGEITVMHDGGQPDTKHATPEEAALELLNRSARDTHSSSAGGKTAFPDVFAAAAAKSTKATPTGPKVAKDGTVTDRDGNKLGRITAGKSALLPIDQKRGVSASAGFYAYGRDTKRSPFFHTRKGAIDWLVEQDGARRGA